MRDHDSGGGTGSPAHAKAFLTRLLRGARGHGGDARARRGFLGRLARDARGNTLAIVGAALVPLAGMIGSGVDMSRAYMAKSRLQSACDAAALAGRRVMQNDTLNTSVTNEATRFFNFNFPQRLYNTATFTPSITKPSSGTIRVTASTTIPTSIMRLFGFTTLPLSVTCDASLNFVNTDVMLVLDTTGSMDEDVNGHSTTTDADRKITALREAVMAMYDSLTPIQTQLETAGMRLRYGVVPYSSTVNVGSLIRSVNASYLLDSTPYQSRTADYTNYGTNTLSDDNVVQTYGSSISQTACNNYGANAGYPTMNGQPAVQGTPPNVVTTITYSVKDWGATGDTSGTNQTCRRNQRTVQTQTGFRATGWTYRQAPSVDSSQYKLGNSVTLATNFNGVMATSQANADPRAIAANAVGASTTTSGPWNGCIEERDTTSTITGSASGYSIPGSAFDLDVNRIPNNAATRWRAMWPDIVYRRTAGSTTATSGTQMSSLDDSYFACPAPAARLVAWTRTAMQNYVNTLNPLGGTYHDIGMIWGARMLSSGGIFADSPDTFSGMPVSRHIIFMTDGQLAPNCNSYTSYGVEQNDQRVTGGGTCPNQYDRHLQRFRMICNAAKSMNISIWVIAFGTTLSSDMQECASNTNQASTAADKATLIARFQQIGTQIGALRLTQ